MKKRYLVPIAVVLCVGALFLVRWATPSTHTSAPKPLRVLTAAEQVKSLRAKAKQGNSQIAATQIVLKKPVTPIYGTRWGREEEQDLKAFSAWAGQFASATPAEKGQLIQAGVELAKERRFVMANLIEFDPAAALASAIPQDIRTELPEEVLAHAERRITGIGSLQVYGVTAERGAAKAVPPIQRQAQLGGRSYQAHTYGVLSNFGTVDDLYMHGVAVGDAIALADSPVRALEAGETVAAGTAIIASHSVELTAAAKPRLAEGPGGYHCLCCSTVAQADYAGSRWAALGEEGTIAAAIGRAFNNTGNKTVLIIPVEFPDHTGSPFSDAEIDEGIGYFKDYFSTASYGVFNVNNATVIALQRMDNNAAHYANSGSSLTGSDALALEAGNKAAAAGYDPRDYDFVSIHINHNLYSWAGLGSIGAASGYTFGITFIDGDDGDSDQHPLEVFIPSRRTTIAYGNPFDAMGNNFEGDYDYDQLHFNASFKNALDWLPDSYITTVTTADTTVSPDVTVNLYAMDRTQVSGRTYAVKIPTGFTLDGVANLDYWVEFRSRYPGVTSIEDGVLIYTANTEHDGGASKLLDMAPATSVFTDAGLRVGSSFTTADSLWRITVNSQSGSGNNTLINVTFTDLHLLDAPVITAHPVSATLVRGTSRTLTVTATGSRLSYQWRKDGADISGATSSSYALTDFQEIAAGSYTVLVRNSGGDAVSNAATIAVLVPPTITTHPVSYTVASGTAVTLTVTATGPGTLTYQWSKGGSVLSGETSASLTIPSCQSTNAGSYVVIVTNADGSVTSNAAVVALSESSGGGGCGHTTPPEQIILIGWAVLLLCRPPARSSRVKKRCKQV